MLASPLLSLALHEWQNVVPEHGCVYPGTCTPPNTTFFRVANGPVPGQQWNDLGGFCGAFSIQHAALSAGAWVSQDLVRKANRDQRGEHHMHGDEKVGFEVMPSNVAYTAANLGLAYEEWDYTQPSPQAPAFKKWLKSQLVRGRPIVWFPMCKGDLHICYPGSCPGGGRVDHVEPMWGIYSNHPLDDTTVYDDDWIVHASDQDYEPYYRPLNSLEDTPDMLGNCKDAGRGFGRNEMYPCFDASVAYGLAVKGLAINSTATLPTSITTDGAVYEPNVRRGSSPKQLTARVSISGLTPRQQYTTFRYDSTATLPRLPPFDIGYSHATSFRAIGEVHTFDDPAPFPSDSAVYYVTVSGGATLDAEAPSHSATPDDRPALMTHVGTGATLSTAPIPSVPLGPAKPSLPFVSLGTGSGQHADVASATSLWLSAGGRAIDTAHDYMDEADVAKGIASSGVPRSEIFLTTKIGCGTYRKAAAMIDDNLRQLGISSVDLLLIHFPRCLGSGSIIDTWRALEDAQTAGKAKAIGVSNFGVRELETLKKSARVWPPAVNQCSMSVGYHDDATIGYCDAVSP